ncbi:MAG: phosphoenolpyruvate--protein phosphotransferase [Polyangiaceae bacterium]
MTESRDRPSSMPPSKKATEPMLLSGLSGSPGIAIGRVVVIGPLRHGYPRRFTAEPELEIARFRRAVQRAQRDLRDVASRAPASAAHSVLEAYVLMAQDPMLEQEVHEHIENDKRCAEWAVATAIEDIADKLSRARDAYLRERKSDIEFVGEHILRAFVESSDRQKTVPTGPVIFVARDLSPADTAALLHGPALAFATESGTRTSHTSIMARALKVPAVVGVTDLLGHVTNNDLVVIDGLRGTVTIQPGDREIDEAERRLERYRMLTTELHNVAQRANGQPAVSTDGVSLKLRANVELPEEAAYAYEEGADGVGLYRTEFLYIDKPALPTEEEQVAIFSSALTAMKGRPLTLRTFDLGGDKFTSTFRLPHELNPMLGLRAVRLALTRPEVFREHLRAMVRTAASGDVRIMVPMVAGLSELRRVRELLERAMDEVRAQGQPCPETIPLGVMIEVPSAAVLADQFAREAAFMSIGTNDLVQYTLAVDRASRRLAYLASPFDPSIVRLIHNVIRAGDEHECPVSVCGAMAADPLAVILLMGLGIRELSMEPGAIAEIREVIRRTGYEEARDVAMSALNLSTADDVEHAFAEAFAPRLYDILSGEGADA